MSPLLAVAFLLAISVVTLIQVILITVKPAYQQLALRCVYGVSVVAVIVLVMVVTMSLVSAKGLLTVTVRLGR